MKFSIIVVCLDSGGKLNQTLDSVLCQTCKDYEIVVKDGGSSDGSLEKIRHDERIKLFVKKDKGIYDAMNQALSHAGGDYIIFLNCGDIFNDNKVLEKAKDFIEKKTEAEKNISGFNGGTGFGGKQQYVFYGDTHSLKNDALIASPPHINGFACYRNIPCHQSCFYSAGLFKDRAYDLKYAIRADYEHFLWCFYRAHAEMHHMGFTVSAYEGGGFSESGKNRARDRHEHKEITEKYIPKKELLKYRLIMALTLAPVRRYLAENKYFTGIYHGMKKLIYGARR